MKRPSIQTLIFVGLLVPTLAHAADSPTKEQEALMQRERDSANAFVQKDAKAVAEWEADEYVFTNYDGVFYEKAKANDAASLKSGALNFTQDDVDQMKAVVFGDAGFVTGRVTQKGTFEKTDMSGVFRFTDTYVKRDGR